MKRTIIFVSVHPFRYDQAKRYGFGFLQEKDFDIVILNIFNWINKGAIKHLPEYNDLYQICGIEQGKVRDQKEFRNALRSIKGWKVVFLCLAPTPALLKVLRELAVPYITHYTWGGVDGLFRENVFDMNLFSRLMGRLLVLFRAPFKTASFLLNKRHSKSWLKKYPPAYHITMARSGEKRRCDDRTIMIPNHTFDYDRYLMNKGNPRPEYIPKDEYILLLPNHPWPIHDDFTTTMFHKRTVTKDEYKELINLFLDRLEKQTGKKIIVSGYPNATEGEDIYSPREFLLGRDTEQLVKYSCGVMGHHTGAFNFAVIHNKPVCLINFRVLDGDKSFSKSMKMYESALSTVIRYVDTEEECRILVKDGVFSINHEAYQHYMSEYVISEQVAERPERMYWDRVVNAL